MQARTPHQRALLIVGSIHMSIPHPVNRQALVSPALDLGGAITAGHLSFVREALTTLTAIGLNYDTNRMLLSKSLGSTRGKKKRLTKDQSSTSLTPLSSEAFARRLQNGALSSIHRLLLLNGRERPWVVRGGTNTIFLSAYQEQWL